MEFEDRSKREEPVSAVVRLFKMLLKRAEEGDIIAFTGAIEAPDRYYVASGGDITYVQQLGLLEYSKHAIMAQNAEDDE